MPHTWYNWPATITALYVIKPWKSYWHFLECQHPSQQGAYHQLQQAITHLHQTHQTDPHMLQLLWQGLNSIHQQAILNWWPNWHIPKWSLPPIHQPKQDRLGAATGAYQSLGQPTLSTLHSSRPMPPYSIHSSSPRYGSTFSTHGQSKMLPYTLANPTNKAFNH